MSVDELPTSFHAVYGCDYLKGKMVKDLKNYQFRIKSLKNQHMHCLQCICWFFLTFDLLS